MSEYEYKLSVVVLVYNTELYLEACLNSLVNQTLDDMEIICVNDESTDNSLNILNKYAKKYDNIKIINQKNQGGAIAGNNGLKMAKGEYVAIMDSDDIVVLDAYEKLYKKAKETDSDVVSGRPNIYMSGFQREVSNKNNIWDSEKTFTIDEYLDIFYDVFYWNKIYRRELVEKHDVYMIPGKIYADVPLVFRAYLFANKISIIPDAVYYWRKRAQEAIIEGDIDTSVSKSLLDISNMKDRLSTYYYLKDYFKEAGKEQYFNYVIKTYLERFFYPISGILKDKSYENAYINEMKAIADDIDHVYDNQLDLKYNLYLYFIRNNMAEELKDFIKFDLREKATVSRDGKVYWNLKYFNNPEYGIPDEFFEVKKVEDIFINIEKISADSKYIHVKNLKLPENLEIDKVELGFFGLTRKDAIKDKNTYRFELTEDSNEKNLYNDKIAISDVKNINSFDMYLVVTHSDGLEELYRMKELHFAKNYDKERACQNSRLGFHFTIFGNFSIRNAFCKDFFEMQVSENSIKLIPDSEGDVNYKMYVEYRRKPERVNFVRSKDELGRFINELELKWKYSLDRNVLYKSYIQMGGDRFILTTDYFKNFKNQTIRTDFGKIKIYSGKNNEVLFKLK